MLIFDRSDFRPLFRSGPIVFGVAKPAKALGFVDLVAEWDPLLALLMSRAILVGFWGS
jgi:hypothetical protein